MVKRLSELYPPNSIVEFTFNGVQWRRAIVIKHDPPGVWLRDRAGQNWFLTNGRHIRPLETDE